MKVVSRKTLTLPQEGGCKICSKKTAPITKSSRSSRRAQVRWRLHACYPKPTHPKQSTSEYHRLLQVSEVAFHPHHRWTKLCATMLYISSVGSQSILRQKRSEIRNLNIHAFEEIWSKDALPNLKPMKKRGLLLQSITWSQPIRVYLKSFRWLESTWGWKSFQVDQKASRSAMPRELPLYTIYSQPGQCRGSCPKLSSQCNGCLMWNEVIPTPKKKNIQK